VELPQPDFAMKLRWGKFCLLHFAMGFGFDTWNLETLPLGGANQTFCSGAKLQFWCWKSS
jgi:hypothetical protein